MDIQIDERSVIVFDLDDTLYNEIEYLRSAYIEIAKKSDVENWKPLFARLFSLYRSGLNAFTYVSETYGLSLQDLLKTYHNHTPNLSPFNGVLETFRRIKDKKGKVCIITDGRKITQNKKIEALGLLDYIDTIIISEETGFEKPERHNYKIIEETFPNGNYWYIADNIRKDFLAPNQMGWKSIGLIDNGLNIHHDSHLHFDIKKSPKYLVLSFEEIKIV